MRPRLRAVAAPHAGLFTRQDALAAGYTRREITSLTRPGGDWAVVRHGVYVERALLADLAQRDRWLLKDRAALLLSRRMSVLSHDSGARVLDIRLLDVVVAGSHLTHRGAGGSRTNAGVTRHRDLLPLCIEVVDDLPTTSYARTALDVARLHGFEHGVVAIDSVRNKGVPRSDLDAELRRTEHHPHAARARAALDASDAGSESVLETLGRQLVEELEIGEIETQFAVGLTGGRVVWCDMRVGCHVFECDGFVKLVDRGEGGVATKPAAQVVWDEKRRETEVCAEGLGMSRIYWADLHGPARERAKARLRKEYAVTVSRFGPVLPEHLRRFADENPRRTAAGLWLPGRLRGAA